MIKWFDDLMNIWIYDSEVYDNGVYKVCKNQNISIKVLIIV